MPEENATFLRPFGLAMDPPDGEGGQTGRALVSEQLLVAGTERIRSSVLACWADMLSGFEANQLSGDQVALTVDLTVRLLAPPVAQAVRLSSAVLKAGRRTTFAEARMTNEHGVTFAVSHMTFQSSPRPQDVISKGALPSFAGGREPARPSYPVPFFDFLGLRTTGPGASELDRLPAVMNPAGTIQGGAVAALVEAASESLRGPVGDLELHYLSAVRVGPGQAHAVALNDELVRIEVRDPGNEGRLATLGLAWPAASSPRV